MGCYLLLRVGRAVLRLIIGHIDIYRQRVGGHAVADVVGTCVVDTPRTAASQ